MTQQQRPELNPSKAFAQVMAVTASPEFFTPERVALIRQISVSLARDPALLRNLEKIFREHADEIERVVPKEAELELLGLARPGAADPQLVAPAAAAAAVAPGAAALAAGPALFVAA
jgi:hypothetical protein